MKLVRQQEIAKNRAKAEDAAEDRILDALLPPPKNQWGEVETTIPTAALAKLSVKNCVRSIRR